MVNLKSGIIGVIATVVVVIMEFLLFPIALTFSAQMNSTCSVRNATGFCTSGTEWITANDRAILDNASTLMIVIILFTLIGGMITSIFVAVKG